MIIITSVNREFYLKELLYDISQQKPDEKVIVLDDGSDIPYDLSGINLDIEYIRFDYRHGKERYWELVAFGFQYLKEKDFKYLFMLPDDVRLHDNFFTESLRIWNGIKSDRKVCLSLGHEHNRHHFPCWTKFKPVQYNEDTYKTMWMDMLFMAERKMFDILKWDIEKFLWNWEGAGSGVGAYISRKLYREGWELFHINKSLVYFQDVPSEMHKKSLKNLLPN